MVTGASVGYVSATGHVPLPKQPEKLHTTHRPWCVDCKRKHDSNDLDSDGRCARCARAAVTRAEAAERRAAEAAELAALERRHQAEVVAQSRKRKEPTPRLPKEGKQGQPPKRRSAPRGTASMDSGEAPGAGPSTIEKNPPAAQETRPAAAGGPGDIRMNEIQPNVTPQAPTLAEDLDDLELTDPAVARAAAAYEAGMARIVEPEDHIAAPGTATFEANLDAQITHVTRLLRATADHPHTLVRVLRINAIAALEALHLAHELHQTPAATTSTPVAAGPRPAAGTRGGEAPRQPATSTDPRKIHLPADDVATAYQAGQTLGQIAETYGVSAPTIRRCLVENNIPRRRSPVEYSPELIAKVRHLYDEENRTQKEIAKQLGYSTKVIQRLMYVAGVNRRAAQARRGADNARGLKDQMADLGITSAHVRAWAHDQGMTDIPIRGLPSQALIDAYVAAHPKEGDTAA